MADTQEQPQLSGENQAGSIREAQEALLGIMEPEEVKPKEEEAAPTEEEESTEETQDESLEEESEEESDEELQAVEEATDEEETEETDEIIEDEEELKMAGLAFKTILVPGHSPGSLCFYFQAQKIYLQNVFWRFNH